jgi:hypothetical protein
VILGRITTHPVFTTDCHSFCNYRASVGSSWMMNPPDDNTFSRILNSEGALPLHIIPMNPKMDTKISWDYHHHFWCPAFWSHLKTYLKHQISVTLKGTTKTNMGQKWYQPIAYDLPSLRWTFFFKFKGPSLFKKRKRVLSTKRHFAGAWFNGKS